MKFHRTMTQIPVADVEKSVKLIERLGFIPFYQDIDPNGTAMLLSPYASVMLMEKRRFERSTQRPLGPTDTSEVIVSIVVDDRRDVDRLVDRVLAGGAREHGEMQDIGTMYQRGFLDLDSHHWKIIWISPTVLASAKGLITAHARMLEYQEQQDQQRAKANEKRG